MGYDADAMVFFGFPLDEDWEPPWDEDEDWENYVADRLGVSHPGAPYLPEHEAAYKRYWHTKRAALKELGAEVGYCGWSEEPRYYIAAIETHHTAYYGQVKSLPPPAHSSKWSGQLHRLAAILGVPFETPDWYLTNRLSV